MSEGDSGPVQLQGWKRALVICIGVGFVVVPILGYLDTRAGWLGTPQPMSEAFGLVMAVLAVIGGVFILSGVLGFWLMWKDVAALNLNKPDPARVTVAASDSADAQSLIADGPPFGGGEWLQTDLASSDRDFTLIAKNYFVNQQGGDDREFDRSVISVWRSKGRPNYAFLIKTPAGPRWIKVPHRGRAGAGAGESMEAD